MAVKQFNTRIQLKRDTSQAWTTANLVLLTGEFGWDSTNSNFKIGDGTTAWGSLNYAIPVGNGTEITTTTVNNYKTLAIGSIDGSKITSLTGYTLTGNTGDVAANDSLEVALAKIENKANAAAAAGVQSIGGATGTVTLGNGLTSTTGADGSVSTKVNGYIVNNAGNDTDALDIDSAKIDSNYTTANTTNLATVGTVTSALVTLTDTLTGTPGAGKTITAFDEVDGKVSATFSDISITSSQISDLSSNAVTGLTGDTWINPSASTGNVTLTHSTATDTASTDTATIGTGNTGVSDTFTTVTYSFDNAGHVNGHTTTTNTIIFPSAADLGLSSAMHFIGTSTTDPSTAGATVSGHTTWEAGDVVLYGNKEYVNTGGGNTSADWVELGDEGSYAQKTVTITGTGALSGGGTLETNRTITHNTSGVTAGSYATNTVTTLTNGGTFNIPQVTVDSYGHITSASDVTLTLPTITANDANLYISDANGESITAFSADASTDKTITLVGDSWILTSKNSGGTGIEITHKGPGTNGADITAVTTASALKVSYDAKGHITGSSALTGSDIAVTSGNYGGTTATTNVQGALDNLTAAVAEGTNGMLSTSATGQSKTPSGESMSDNIVLHDIAKTGNTDDLIQGLTILLDCGTASTVTDVPAAS